MPHNQSNSGLAHFDQASQLVDALRAQGLTLAVAESCTGGLLSAAITDVPGASDVFQSGFITYANCAKTEMVGVPSQVIETYGAVSAEVARAMADGVLENSTADVSASVTGIAGPGGGSAEKPVGLVFIAVARRGSPSVAHRHVFEDLGRAQIRNASVETSLSALRDLIGAG